MKNKKKKREKEILHPQYFLQQILSDRLLLVGKKVISMMGSNRNQ